MSYSGWVMLLTGHGWQLVRRGLLLWICTSLWRGEETRVMDPICAILEAKKPQSSVYSDSRPRSGDAASTSSEQLEMPFPGERFKAQLAAEMIAAARHSCLASTGFKSMFAYLVVGTKVQLALGTFPESYFHNFGFTEEDHFLGKGSQTTVAGRVSVNISKEYDLMLASDRLEILKSLAALKTMASVWDACQTGSVKVPEDQIS